MFSSTMVESFLAILAASCIARHQSHKDCIAEKKSVETTRGRLLYDHTKLYLKRSIETSLGTTAAVYGV